MISRSLLFVIGDIVVVLISQVMSLSPPPFLHVVYAASPLETKMAQYLWLVLPASAVGDLLVVVGGSDDGDERTRLIHVYWFIQTKLEYFLKSEMHG